MPDWRIGSLFSGIGGLELGLEQAGIGHTVFHVEADPFCREVLGKRWPGVPCYHDVREVGAGVLPACDLLVGGFPCQDVSNAGKRAGLEGERSGLWSEFARLIGELRPRVVVVENVAALLNRGADRVLGGLATLGYDAQWGVVSAASVGAWHERNRLFITAADPERVATRLPDASGHGLMVGGPGPAQVQGMGEGPRLDTRTGGAALPYAQGIGQPLREAAEERPRRPASGRGYGGIWQLEPPVGRVADGVPARVDRLRSLGNAVVPEVARGIGLGLLERGWL